MSRIPWVSLCNRWITVGVTYIEKAFVLPMITAAAFVIAGDDSKTFGTLQHVGSVRSFNFGYAGVSSAFSYSRICISFVHLLFPEQLSTVTTLSTIKIDVAVQYQLRYSSSLCLVAPTFRTAKRQGVQRTPPDRLQICK